MAEEEPPDLLDELGVRHQVVEQVRVHSAAGEHADRTVEALWYAARRLERRPGALEKVAVLRVHERSVARADAEQLGVEPGDVVEHAGAEHVVWGSHQRGRQSGGDQLVGDEISEAVVAAPYSFPQRVDVGGAGEPPRHTDDGDGALRVAHLVGHGAAHGPPPPTRAAPSPTRSSP